RRSLKRSEELLDLAIDIALEMMRGDVAQSFRALLFSSAQTAEPAVLKRRQDRDRDHQDQGDREQPAVRAAHVASLHRRFLRHSSRIHLLRFLQMPFVEVKRARAMRPN